MKFIGNTAVFALVLGLALPALASQSQPVTDSDLQAHLASRLRYDRAGLDNQFNYLTVTVHDGIATLGGEVRTDTDRASAVAVAQNMRGVEGVRNEIKVAPASFFDDGLRLKLSRAIYGDSVLRRYSMDPQAPIRIVVNGGHVTLYGVVANQMDRQIAGIQANSVPGVFSVDNQLVVAR